MASPVPSIRAAATAEASPPPAPPGPAGSAGAPAGEEEARRAAAGAPTLWQRSAAEFVGTGLLVLIGPGTAAFNALIVAHTHQPANLADVGVVSLAFAIIVMALVYCFGHISGCHINPAVTLGLAVVGRFPWRDVPAYLLAQFLGAVLGALGIVLVLGPPGAAIGNLGATVLAPTTGYLQGIAIEAVEAFVLMLVIMGTAVDGRAPRGMAGLAIGFTVGAIIMMTAAPTGSSFNPARTFGPYVGDSLFGGHIHWIQFPVYLIGPILGALIAAWVYSFIAWGRATAPPPGS
ncbi:putative aquaporin AqpM [Candidatus Hydrogenisulfobacillus filiaventi]|uniref:Putative aquaporin AqpM n=1 Tax=Candidatus Hydrogenisulfobacillus filiaventi TaxID=2707344 RepID=A0A6F8ZIW5_9FIRM|nr:aquaporin family protein [Bacillota bacterium]CAB1129391.1 putative aquaporin AqpM [Candidatus Hydrogenisulfobacillus filiaventi]